MSLRAIGLEVRLYKEKRVNVGTLEIEATHPHPDALHLKFSGELDFAEVLKLTGRTQLPQGDDHSEPPLERIGKHHLASFGEVALDLSGVTFIDQKGWWFVTSLCRHPHARVVAVSKTVQCMIALLHQAQAMRPHHRAKPGEDKKRQLLYRLSQQRQLAVFAP